MKILLCTDGSSHTVRGLNLGTQVARAAASSVDIVAVAEPGQEEDTNRLVEAAAADLEEAGVPVTIHRRSGRITEEVVRQAQATPYDLLIIGSRGRRGVARLLLGSVALHVTGRVPASVLVVKGRAGDFRRFLVCSSAGPVSEHAIRFAGRLARALEASVTLLHVISQLPLAKGVVLDDLEASVGVHLSQMLDLLAAEGVVTRAVVRHGLVRDEIIAEAQEGQYDLLVTGAHVTPGLNARLVDDLSADILLAANCPVLIVRHEQ